jgi:hypothetical protein
MYFNSHDWLATGIRTYTEVLVLFREDRFQVLVASDNEYYVN